MNWIYAELCIHVYSNICIHWPAHTHTHTHKHTMWDLLFLVTPGLFDYSPAGFIILCSPPNTNDLEDIWRALNGLIGCYALNLAWNLILPAGCSLRVHYFLDEHCPRSLRTLSPLNIWVRFHLWKYCTSFIHCGMRWLVGRFNAYCPKVRGFKSSSVRYVGTLGKSFTHNCMWRLAWNSDTVSVLCRERLWIVVDLKRRYRNSLNK